MIYEYKVADNKLLFDYNEIGIHDRWIAELHPLLDSEYMSHLIHYLHANTINKVELFPNDINDIFKPLSTNLDDVRVVFITTSPPTTKFANGLCFGEDRKVKVPVNYLNSRLQSFREACFEYRTDNCTSANDCEINSDYDISLNYLNKQNVVMLNLKPVTSLVKMTDDELTDYTLPLIREIIDTLILGNNNVIFIVPSDVDLEYYTTNEDYLSFHTLVNYSNNKDSILKALKTTNEMLSLTDKYRQVQW